MSERLVIRTTGQTGPGSGGGGGATNLSYTASPTQGVVVSDTGTDATVPLADATNAGLMSPAQRTAVNALASTYQPLDSDLTAIAALTTTTFGRSLLALADAAALRTSAGLVIGTDVAAQSSLASYLTTAAAASGYQPLDSDLTAIAALTTTTFGRSLLALADAAALRTSAGLVIGTDVAAQSHVAATTVHGISAYGATLVDDANAAAARSTLGLAALATKATIAVPGDVTATGTPDGTTFLRGDGAWATPAGGGANWTQIATVGGTTTTAAITFSSIPATYTHLMLMLEMSATSPGGVTWALRFNGDTGTNYQNSTTTSIPVFILNGGGSAPHLGSGAVQILMPFYKGSLRKAASVMGLGATGGGTNAISYYAAGRWESGAAVTDVSIFTASAQTIIYTATLYGGF